MIKADTDVTKALKVIVPEILDRYLQDEPALDEGLREASVSKRLANHPVELVGELRGAHAGGFVDGALPGYILAFSAQYR